MGLSFFGGLLTCKKLGDFDFVEGVVEVVVVVIAKVPPKEFGLISSN